MRLKSTGLLAAAMIASLWGQRVSAKVSDSEAALLKTTLTPVGAERAGNKDGTIPAWTGGMSQLPPGLKATDKMPDFYKDDPKVLTIDASNVDQYSDKLSVGTIYMIKHYAGYRVNIYPTHRPAAMPQWFYDATLKNATTAEIKDDNWVINAHGGIPFPIPKTGKEAIWNLNLAWFGPQTRATLNGYIVPPGQRPLLNGTTDDVRWRPYSDPDYVSGQFSAYYLLARESTIGPPNRIGEAILAYVPYDQTRLPQITWQYLVGQRRLRKAPQVTYDGAYPDCGGIITIDETSLFNGPPDRYNIKIIGKQEMYIPYDGAGMEFHKANDLMLGSYLNPDFIRWELHRVWVVDLTLAPGKHHLLPHRRVYLDEDTWGAALSEDYDSQGTLWKIGQAFNTVAPAIPAVTFSTNVFYDTRGAGYCLAGGVTADRPQDRVVALPERPFPPSYFSPNTVAAESIR